MFSNLKELKEYILLRLIEEKLFSPDRIDRVVSVGIGKDKIIIGVTELTIELQNKINNIYSLEFIEIEKVEKIIIDYAGGNRLRNGTFACPVYEGELQLLLTNAHVVCDPWTTDPLCEIGAITSSWIEPYNGIIGNIHNLVFNEITDAALIKPLESLTIEKEILGGIGEVTKIGTPYVGQQVRKYGRNTGYQTGEVTQIDTTCGVNYGLSGNTIWFQDIIITNIPRASGDSGSLVVDNNSKAIGLHVAGGTRSYELGIKSTLEALNVTLQPPKDSSIMVLLGLGLGLLAMMKKK